MSKRMYAGPAEYITARIELLRKMYVAAVEDGDRLAQYTVCARFFELHEFAEHVGVKVEHPDVFFSSANKEAT